MKLGRKLLVLFLSAVTAAAMMAISASACTMIYVGADLTEDGTTLFARSEDISNSQNKVFQVVQAGTHKKGEKYWGCYGFTYTFSHASYGYTAFRDDNLLGQCPDCGGTHIHTPYEEAGTNDQGVTVTATVTLGANEAALRTDPMDPLEDLNIYGIEEAEITIILLSEAASAREAVDILTHIYDTVGADGGSGILISDQKETWYIENCTGTQYVAIRLAEGTAFLSPNMSVIGRIDLDDENVIASAKLIETAVAAGTFVGDAENHIIDYRASYANDSIGERMASGLNYLSGKNHYTVDNLTSDDFTISNLDGSTIVDAYTAITLDREITTRDMVDLYKVAGIGNERNLEYHVYRINANGSLALSTVEWVGMDHGQYGVVVPHYPMLTTDTYRGYQVGTEPAAFVLIEPDSGAYYASTNHRLGEGYTVLPEGWEDSCYWCFDAVSNYVLSDDCTRGEEQLVLSLYAELQERIYDEFDALTEKLEDGGIFGLQTASAAKLSTKTSEDMAQRAHALAYALYQAIAEENYNALSEYVYFELRDGEDVGVVFPDEAEPQVQLPKGFTMDAGGNVTWEKGGTFALASIVTDVSSRDWYAQAVRFGMNSGLFTGTSVDGRNLTFSPDGAVSRGMFVTLLYRLSGDPKITERVPAYSDVPAGAYYADAVDWARFFGIVNGRGDNLFDPDATVTRQEMVSMLYRFEQYRNSGVKGDKSILIIFRDADAVGTWAEEAMAWAITAGYIHGTGDGMLSPTATTRRCEAAQMLMNYCLTQEA